MVPNSKTCWWNSSNCAFRLYHAMIYKAHSTERLKDTMYNIIIQRSIHRYTDSIKFQYAGTHRESSTKALTLLSEGGPSFGYRLLSEESWHTSVSTGTVLV